MVDEVTGKMYLAKGEHLMRITETASHRRFQDHELSISRHIQERENSEQEGQSNKKEIKRGEENITDPLMPISGAAGAVGRTPIPVAESTHQQEGEAPTPREHKGDEGRGESEWVLPRPTEP